MGIEAIYIALAFAGFLLWLGLHKEEVWFVVFSGIIFLFSGLNIFINGFVDMPTTYSKVMGIIVIFFGSYVSIHSTMEFIKENL